MQPHALNPDGPAILVEGRVRHALQIKRRKETGEQPGAVVTFPHEFLAVVQFPVPNQEVQPASSQVDRMYSGDAAAGEGGGAPPLLSPPPPPPPTNPAPRPA